MSRMLTLSGVSVLEPHPYALRHGGASTDVLLKRRDLQEVKSRGRWRTDSSVRRYNKHARILREVARLPDESRAYGEQIAQRLDDSSARRRRALVRLQVAASNAVEVLHGSALRSCVHGQGNGRPSRLIADTSLRHGVETSDLGSKPTAWNRNQKVHSFYVIADKMKKLNATITLVRTNLETLKEKFK